MADHTRSEQNLAALKKLRPSLAKALNTIEAKLADAEDSIKLLIAARNDQALRIDALKVDLNTANGRGKENLQLLSALAGRLDTQRERWAATEQQHMKLEARISSLEEELRGNHRVPGLPPPIRHIKIEPDLLSWIEWATGKKMPPAVREQAEAFKRVHDALPSIDEVYATLKAREKAASKPVTQLYTAVVMFRGGTHAAKTGFKSVDAALVWFKNYKSREQGRHGTGEQYTCNVTPELAD